MTIGRETTEENLITTPRTTTTLVAIGDPEKFKKRWCESELEFLVASRDKAVTDTVKGKIR